MVYITQSGRIFPDTIRFYPDEVRRVAPDMLVSRGLFSSREEAARAIELVISMAEKEEAGTLEKSE